MAWINNIRDAANCLSRPTGALCICLCVESRVCVCVTDSPDRKEGELCDSNYRCYLFLLTKCTQGWEGFIINPSLWPFRSRSPLLWDVNKIDKNKRKWSEQWQKKTLSSSKADLAADGFWRPVTFCKREISNGEINKMSLTSVAFVLVTSCVPACGLSLQTPV